MTSRHGVAFRAARFVLVLLLLVVLWELVKLVFGDVWRYKQVFGSFDVLWKPPLHQQFASDLNMPHIWDVIGALINPVQRNAKESLGQFLIGAGVFTWQEAAAGFVAGGLLGLAIATVFVHSGLLERAFSPYVVASQMIVSEERRSMRGVCRHGAPSRGATL